MLDRCFRILLLAALFLTPWQAQAQKLKEQSSEESRLTPESTRSAPRSAKLARVAKGIFKATNQFRKQNDRGKLRVNSQLSRTAQYFAEYIARTGKFSHTADGKEPWERVADYGYEYCLVAENIALRYSSSGYSARDLVRGFMKSWKNSPGHRKNMLDPDVTEIGVGVARSKEGKYYAVQDFGRPKSATIRFRISNRTNSRIDYSVDGKSYTIRPRYTVSHWRCRRPRLKVQLPGENQTASTQGGQEFHPRNGSMYVIRKNRSGDYAVKER
jgi:uncharacterized protein YkwD